MIKIQDVKTNNIYSVDKNISNINVGNKISINTEDGIILGVVCSVEHRLIKQAEDCFEHELFVRIY